MSYICDCEKENSPLKNYIFGQILKHLIFSYFVGRAPSK